MQINTVSDPSSIFSPFCLACKTKCEIFYFEVSRDAKNFEEKKFLLWPRSRAKAKKIKSGLPVLESAENQNFKIGYVTTYVYCNAINIAIC